MNKVFVIFLLFCFSKGQDLLDCQTSNGEIGECVSIFACPSLLSSFENPNEEDEIYLKKLICNGNNTVGVHVCCDQQTEAFGSKHNDDNATIDETLITTTLDNCGLQNEPDELVKKGVITLTEFPWLVAVVKSPDKHSTFISETVASGSLVNARYVLTDAEAIPRNTHGQYYYVRIAEFNVSPENCAGLTLSYIVKRCAEYTDYDIDQRIIHPFYDSGTRWNNIALLRLATVVSFKHYNRPLCFPTLKTKILEQQLFLSTWNRTIVSSSNKNKWSFQKKVSIKLIPKELCQAEFNSYLTNDEKYLCVSKVENASTTQMNCNDIVGSQVTSFDGTQWNLEGISNMCANNGSTIMFTNISNYIPWIRHYIKNEQCETPDGTQGRCIHLTECPELIDAFANPQQTHEQYLIEFSCDSNINSVTYINEFKIWEYPLVCCSSLNFTTPSEDQLQELAVDPDARQRKPLSSYCGIQNRDGYALKSENITTDEFPWVAAIYKVLHGKTITDKVQRDSPRYAGALITSRYVITGSYALNEFNIAKQSIIVRLGEYKPTDDKDCLYFSEFESEDCSKVADYEVERAIGHPFFNFYNNMNDIALLRLDRTVEFSDYIRPICLPPPDLNLNTGNVLYGSGYGYQTTQHSIKTSVKKKISSVYLTNEECIDQFLISYKKFISPHHLCATYLKNKTEFTCTGDSGGPLMVSVDQKWYLVGILSESTCEYKWPQIHTRVSNYLPWIYDIIRKSSGSFNGKASSTLFW